MSRSLKLAESLLVIDGDLKKRKQFADLANLVLKPSSALEQMMSFLPQLAAANSIMDAQLQLNPTSYNMEEVEGVEGPLIEMNVALVDMGDKDEEEVDSSDVDSGASVDDSSTDSDSNDDDQSEKPSMTEKNFRIKLQARRRRLPIIEVLGGDEVASSPSSEEGLGECSASEDLASSPSPAGGIGESSSGCSDDDSPSFLHIGAPRDGGMEDSV